MVQIGRPERQMIMALLAFIFITTLQFPSQNLGRLVSLACLAFYLCFLLLMGLYCFAITARGKDKDRYVNWLGITLWALGALMLLIMAMDLPYFNPLLSIFVSLFFNDITSIAYIVPFFLISLGAYFYKVLDRKRLGIGTVILALVILLIYFAPGLIHTRIKVNDEELLTFFSVKTMFAGMNPYATPFYPQLLQYKTANGTGLTLTTNNTVSGTMDYPALFFLSFVPFYLLSAPTLANFASTDLLYQQAVFAFLLILSVVYVTAGKDPLKPKYLVIAAVVFFAPFSLSEQTLLLAAVFIPALVKPASRYSWMLIGVAASIQQEVWFPAALLVLYNFNSFGWRKGGMCLAYAAAMFALINGYFILANPGAFITPIFSTLGGSLFPSPSGAIGYSIYSNYGTGLQVYSQLFLLSSVALVIAFVYFNDRRLIPIFSLIPFLFLSHAQVSYYVMYIFMFLIMVSADTGPAANGFVRKTLGKSSFPIGKLALAAIFAIALAGAALVFASHQSYASKFNASVSNATSYISGNTLYYNATMHYSPSLAAGSGMYVILTYYRLENVATDFGFYNSSIVNGSVKCQYPCSININKIRFNPSGNQALRLYSTNITNTTDSSLNFSPIYIQVELYNTTYAYQSSMVKVAAK